MTTIRTHSNDLAEILATASVIVTAGTGGVGKTTMAAAIALAQARNGRRCVVITIDPAKRLAEALGLPSLTNDPQRIEIDSNITTGELWACMLDTKATFDAIVRREASPEQAEQVLANRFYLNISGTLSGTQEYMAAEKVHELVTSERYDVVVIDTPPAANALDFITAPRRLVRFLDHSLFRLIIAPGKGALRFVSTAAQTVLKPLTSVIGGAVVSDAIEFFQLFDGLEVGFRERAAKALEVLTAHTTAWVLVTTSEPEPLRASLTFTSQIGQTGIHISGVVMNQTEPHFDDLPSKSKGPLGDVIAQHTAATKQDEIAADQLRNALGQLPVQNVPRLSGEVANTDSLVSLASWFS
jgi:anion-transporting  ArsA/GET3 family ATPase